MSKKSAALEAKFEIAVKTLLKAPNLTVQEAMLVAKFSTKDIENKSMQKIIARRIPGGKRAMAALLPPALLPPSIVIDVPRCHSPQISNLTTLSGATEISGHIQPPKRKQQKMTTRALQQKRVEDLKQKSPFQSALRTNLQLLIDERIRKEKPTSLSPWIVGLVVFGGCDPETELIVRSAFQEGFNHAQNIRAWEKVGAVPLSRKCLESNKVRRSIGDGDDDQKALVYLIQEHNTLACTGLTLAGYNGDHMKLTAKPAPSTKVITNPHTQERIELLSEAKKHGQIFAATGGDHLTSNDMFKAIELKRRKILRDRLEKEKTLRQRQERTESNAWAILEKTANDPTKLTASDLTILLTWHQQPKVASMKKDAKLNAWLRIVEQNKVPPPFEKWTDADDMQLEEAKSDIVEMEHTHLGHMETLKKKELILAARAMSQEEFDQLVADRHSLVGDSMMCVSLPTSEAAPANELIVDPPPNSDALVDTPPPGEDEGGI